MGMNDTLWLIRKLRMYPLRAFGIIVGSCGLAVSGFMILVSIPDFLHADDVLFHLLLLFLSGHLVALFMAGPAVLSIYNILYLVIPHSSETMRKRSQRMEAVTIVFGGLCFYLSTAFTNVNWNKNWWEQLYNEELHAPVATWTYPTLIAIGAIGLAGYLVLYIARRRSLPPLLTVLGLGGLYLGAGLCLVLFVQLCKNTWIQCVYLGNLLLIFLKVIKELVLRHRDIPLDGQHKIRRVHRLLGKGKNLPWVGLLMALPLLGIALAILTLFGQEPDSIIQAWTQTSDWTFSQQVAPPNLPMDYHYLCTVAAGGHRRLVKPLRMGKRHGHWVLVNRQLAVANAFEELLQQRLPRFHRVLRGAYDRYGYPIANHIRSPWAADAVWLLMKPAEWFFLGVLYLFDRKPENRIAVQYPHSPIPKMDET